MTQFKGTHPARRDSKGRISIPAPFRALLRNGETPGPVVLRPSHKHPCIEGWHPDAFAAKAARVADLPGFSDAEEDFALALYSDATDAEPDREGRIILPRSLVDHAGLADDVVFLGLGSHFQIWEPAAAVRRVAEARSRAQRVSLPASLAAGGK